VAAEPVVGLVWVTERDEALPSLWEPGVVLPSAMEPAGPSR
jgi:hypothetical protein